MGISPEEAVEAVSLLLDNWRRSRYLFVTNDPIFSRYHPKDDPYIQAGLLNLRDFHPRVCNWFRYRKTATHGGCSPSGVPRRSRRSSRSGRHAPTRWTWMRR